MRRVRSSFAGTVGWIFGMLVVGASAALGANAAVAATTPSVLQAQPALGPALPAFAVSARAPSYTLNSNCSAGGGAITFHLIVSNTGVGPSTAITQDQGGVLISTAMQTIGHPGSLWSAAAALPAIPAHGSVPIDVTLMPLSPPSLMAGSHVFSVLVNAVGHVKTASATGNSTNISVIIPAGFCPNMTAAMARTLVTLSPAPVVSPGTTMRVGGIPPSPPASSKMTHALPVHVQAAPVVASPANLQYTNSPSVCNAHAPGLAGVLICPGLIAGTSALPLVWDWQACAGVGCVSHPDGFHIYKVTNTVSTMQMIRLGTRNLVDTQSDPTLTIRGISPYAKTDCYVVTAYKGATESSDSNQWCGDSNLAMGTAWKEVNPVAGSQNAQLPIPCDALPISPYPSDPNNHEGLVKYNGLDHGTLPPMDCVGDLIYHASYKFDLSALKTISKVILVAYFTQEKVSAGEDIYGVPHEVSTTYPSAITGLTNLGDPGSQVSLQADTYGVTADITRFFAIGRVVNVGFSHNQDPDALNPRDTCLTAFKGAHIDVTYFP